jgi:preprotein translocase subunit SecE
MEAASSNTGVGAKFEPRRIVGVSYVVFGLLGALIFGQLIGKLLELLRWNDPQLLGVTSVSSLLGVVLGAGIMLFCYFNQRIYAGSLDIAAELKKVTWPSLAETRVSTIAVIIASVVSALILFFFDIVWSKVMTVWAPQFLGWLARL